MDRVSRPYQNELIKALSDPIEAMEYLNTSLEEDDPDLFLLALENVAKAKAKKASAYNKQKETQQFQNISFVSNFLNNIGLRLSVVSRRNIGQVEAAQSKSAQDWARPNQPAVSPVRLRPAG